MKKGITLFILALMTVSFYGCTGSTFNSSEKNKLKEAGRAALELYLEENLPGAQVKSVNPVEAYREMTQKTLINYIHGEYKADGVTCEYYFDTKNKRLFTSRRYSEFAAHVKEKIMEDIGLKDKAEILSSEIEIYLPDMQEAFPGNSTDYLFPYTVQCIPFETVEYIEAYVNDEKRNEIISVNMTLTLDATENTDISTFTFGDFYYKPLENNMYITYLCIYNALSVTYDRIGYGATPTILSVDRITAAGEDYESKEYRITYELFDDGGDEESGTRSVIYRKKEFLDTETGDITSREEHSE